MQGRIAALAILVYMTMATNTIGATDRFYPNFVEVSPNGQLRLEAKSPENTPGRNAPFAANFVYTLYENSTSKVVWTRAQPQSDRFGMQQNREGSPRTAFVHDSGVVVVWTAFDDLLVLDDKGAVALHLSILDAIPRDEQQSHVRWTTAGMLWAGNSNWYYFTAERKLHFGIQTRWNRRILVCIPDGKLVADERPVRDGAEVGERNHVLTILRTASDRAKQWTAKGHPEYSRNLKNPWNEVPQLGAAIALAEQMKIEDAAPFLLDLERVSDFRESTRRPFETVPAGELFIGSHSFDRWRCRVQLAIRRLGGTPLSLPSNEMIVAKANNEWGEGYRPKKHDTPRSTRVPLITSAMSAKEVVDTLGEPDYIRGSGNIGEHFWEYDIDATEPFTLRVVWKDNKQVRTDRLIPPVWKVGPQRNGTDE